MSKKKICIASSTSWLVRGRSRRRICITNYANINGSDRNNWAPLYARNLLELDGQSAIIVLDNGGCVFHPNVTTVSIIVTADSKENPGIGHVGVEYAPPPFQAREQDHIQACLRPRDRFWDIPVPIIDSAFDNLLVPQPSWSPSTTQQLRKLVAAPYLSSNDWTPRLNVYFASPLALCARRVSSAASRLLGTTSLRFALHGWQRRKATYFLAAGPR